jgi:hypothetical protein
MLPLLVRAVAEASDAFRGRYKGTGAKYLTLEAVSDELRGLGWRPVIVKAGAKLGICDCDEVIRHDQVDMAADSQ